MDFTKEQLQKAKTAKSAEELAALAKENGVTLTDGEAAKYFADLHKNGELADDELNNVAGGDCDFRPTPDPLFNAGEMVCVRKSCEVRTVIIMERLAFNSLTFLWHYKVYDTESDEIYEATESAMFRK